MLIYGLIMMGSVLVLVIVGYFSIKDFDLSLVLSGWLGLYLLMATYAADRAFYVHSDFLPDCGSFGNVDSY